MTTPPTEGDTKTRELVTPAPASKVKVWDPVVRLFHWTLALGCIANLTLLRHYETPHRIIGYVIATALAARLLWGAIGSRHARFTDFVPGPRRLAGYLAALARGREPRYLGHNPAGAMMMLALMALVGACALTGWMMGLDAFWGDQRIKGAHEAAANLILLMAIIHILAALAESWRHRENLIAAMLTGWKRAPSGTDVDHATSADRG